jgi:hypothetical protein
MDTTESRTFAARLADLLKHEHHAMADFLVALAEFDRKRGWLELGFSNLFDFAVVRGWCPGSRDHFSEHPPRGSSPTG